MAMADSQKIAGWAMADASGNIGRLKRRKP